MTDDIKWNVEHRLHGFEGLPPGVYTGTIDGVSVDDYSVRVDLRRIQAAGPAAARGDLPPLASDEAAVGSAPTERSDMDAEHLSVMEWQRRCEESRKRSWHRRRRAHYTRVVVWNLIIWFCIAVTIAIVVGILALVGGVR
jgi:hypothetical protein